MYLPCGIGKEAKNVRKKQQYAKIFLELFIDISSKVGIISSCMDKRKDCKIPEYGTAADLKNHKLVVGTKQLKKALRDGRAKTVFLAENADPALTQMLDKLCADSHVPVHWVRSMAELGKYCGIEVGAAAAAVVK